METYGKLTVRMFIVYAQDEYGRVTRGSWKTLMSKWVDREDVEQTLSKFADVNPTIHHQRPHLDVKFTVQEHISM